MKKNKFGVIEAEDQIRPSSPTFQHHSSPNNHIHMQGVRATESMKKTEWTNEKHSMYLKSIEATFVNQLYDSKHMVDPASTSGQFKILRRGCWQKMNFERENPQIMRNRNNNNNNNKERHVLTSNPWIQHYRASNKSLQECVTSASQIVDLSHRKKGLTSLHLNDSHVCHQDMLSSDTEMSDQNFVGEELEVEKENKTRNKAKRKRQKASIVDAKGSNDQIVPSRKSSAIGEVTKNFLPAA